jgi:hypothetical protein
VIISSHIDSAVAAERQADLVARASRRGPREAGRLARLFGRAEADVGAAGGEVTIRRASERDAGVVQRLAVLDGKRAPAGPFLIAEVDGRPQAALAVSDRVALADPFEPTAHLVSLLELRARQLEQAGALAPEGAREAWEPRFAA